jgi:Ca-activated chloride channel family protein
MDARDLGPKSRLETAKEVMQEFLSARKGDRIGLVAFAAEAVAVSPLTLDYGTLLGLIGDINFNRLPQGTALGNGLAAAVNLCPRGL